MSERSNAGYIIISAIRVGDTEYVLGENPKAPARFVTWVCRNGSDYFWGRYTDDPLSALRNLLDRAGPGAHWRRWSAGRERRRASMRIERFPLQDRLDLLDTGRCAHPEYAAAIIHRFADMTLPEYFQGFEAELERLRSALGLSRERVQSMTYKQLAKALDDRLSATPSCGDAYLYDAAVLLLPPLLDTPPEQTELEEDGAPPLGQPLLPPRSLEERLKTGLTPRDCVLVDMEAGSLIRFMDELVAPCAAEFTAIYEQYFQQYGNKTVSELAADCAAMPEAERQTVLYELLIHPFASLEEHPNKRYCP